MKSSILAFSLLFAFLLQGVGQVPKQFSYQAVLRNIDGSVMVDQPVNIIVKLRKTSETGNVIFTETHNKTTTGQGLISLLIGSVNTADFSTIPWNESIFIQIDVKKTSETTYQTIGPSQILSVPYALYAGNVKEVKSQSSSEDAIFEVKNSNGEVVFGVYQGGVRIYVDDSPIIKGARGGFAVGGLSQVKGIAGPEYLRITSDSTRIYINDKTVKGARGGFAVGGLSNTKNSTNTEYFKVTKDTSYFKTTIFSTSNIVSTGNISSGGGVVSEPVLDVEGHTYQTIKIGSQIWMKENLRATKYSDGSVIDPFNVQAYKNTSNLDTINNYGRLYNGNTLSNQSLNVCPDGWHVPVKLDWDSLMVFVGGPYWQTNSIITGLKIMESGIKSNGTGFWDKDINANNVSGFSGRPGGEAMMSTQWMFSGLGLEGTWWVGQGINQIVKLDGNTGEIGYIEGFASNAYSVRCIKGPAITIKK